MSDITGKSAVRCKIWVASSPVEARNPNRRIPATCGPLCLIRPSKDIIVLPSAQESVADFWEFMKEALHLEVTAHRLTVCACALDLTLFVHQPGQVIWAKEDRQALCLDDAIDESTVSRMMEVVESKADQVTIVPRAVSPNFQRWMKQIDLQGVKVFGEGMAGQVDPRVI